MTEEDDEGAERHVVDQELCTSGSSGVPVVEWEILGLRKVIPPELQALIGVASPVVRVSESIDRKQRRKHWKDIVWYERLSDEFLNWEFLRKQPPEEAAGSKEERWQVVLLLHEDGQSIPLLVILEMRPDGVLYLRSLHRRQPQWVVGFSARSGVVRRDRGVTLARFARSSSPGWYGKPFSHHKGQSLTHHYSKWIDWPSDPGQSRRDPNIIPYTKLRLSRVTKGSS